jgi:hypothetical protein
MLIRGFEGRMTRRLLFAMAVFSATGTAAKKKKKGKEAEPLGLISGTVFDADGRSLPGATVTITDAANPKVHFEAISSPRGEFNVRTPADANLETARKYVIRAEAKGFEPAEKTVEVYQAQRTNANLLLDPKK